MASEERALRRSGPSPFPAGVRREQEQREQLRRAEIELVRDWIKPGMRVLEIGGANGLQASILTSWNCDVVSLDMPREEASSTQYYPVQEYDGRVLPVQDSSFDCVYSSNVLEHIQPVESFLSETKRVMKPDGVAVHILPSPVWRFWTSGAHYPFLLKLAFGVVVPSREAGPGEVPRLRETLRRRGLARLLTRVVLPGPHGEYPNAVAELYYFSRARWTRLFQRTGFEVRDIRSTGLFYTGYLLFPRLSPDTRRRLARLLGSACNIFILKLAPPGRRTRPGACSDPD